MRTELEHIANPGDRSGWIWLERPLLQPIGSFAKNDMIDFGRREPGDLDRRVQQDQLFKLNLQRVEIPLSFFREAVDGKPQHALFVRVQVLDAHARDSIEAQLLRRLEAGFAVDDLVVATDQERIAETEEADRGSDLPHMSRIKLTQLPTGGSKLSERNVGKLQAREHVVTPAMRRGRQRHPFLGLPTVAALPSQLVAESCAGCNRIEWVGHRCPALRINKKQQINMADMKCSSIQSVPSGPPIAGALAQTVTRSSRVRNRRK